ncbi:aminopeptidase P family protein [Peptoniphilus sp. oral taxon 386]|uniref:aminopeptidase P family protein n=1 Tax=Peptoniphilus sp. oral taxon 386 TaxID=652713 RepID=UPI0001DA9B48|nr:aminopeptidase P family protein [Peptoniphilus sp. oral taxon 386]EFI42321.1 peptidase, M24 family [Peptoniphilus sp. oral taxon 386 str. F0131]
MVLKVLRNEMKKNKIDCYIIPTLDPHSSEYLPDYYKERQFVTGFTGSAGTAVVTNSDAFLWTDGRYFIQAESQIKDNGFKLMKIGIEGYPTIIEWLSDNLKSGSVLGLNAKYYLQSDFENLELKLNKNNISIIDIDLIKDIWQDRISLPNSKVFIHEHKYSGRTSEQKIEDVRKVLSENNANLTIISKLDDIAWLFNIRCNDIEHTPVVISYAIVEMEKVYIFINKDKLDDNVIKYLSSFSEIINYDDVFEHVKKYFETNIYIDKSSINHKLFSEINESNNVISGDDLIEGLKTVKNPIEIQNIKNAHIRDGVALTKFIYWIKRIVKDEIITEYEAAQKLRKFREEQALFTDESFETISAYGKNAAMMHYSASEEKASVIENKGFLLVDSGAQYLDGTTDITRTIAVGELTDEEITDFTYVLKSHFVLSSAVFLKGTKDSALDAIARYPLWKIHSDYKCGTGHGVGYFLGVHENPPWLSPRALGSEIKEGMIFSDEPGVYKEGKFGIRTENILEVVKDIENESGIFLKFNLISFAPIEREAINVNLLDDFELKALNEYHKEVYEKISPFLNSEERSWLYEVTKEMSK